MEVVNALIVTFLPSCISEKLVSMEETFFPMPFLPKTLHISEKLVSMEVDNLCQFSYGNFYTISEKLVSMEEN